MYVRTLDAVSARVLSLSSHQKQASGVAYIPFRFSELVIIRFSVFEIKTEYLSFHLCDHNFFSLKILKLS